MRPPADHVISEQKAISVACPKCREKFLVPLPPDDSQLKLEAAAQECEEMAAMVQHIHNCSQRDLSRARAKAMEEAQIAVNQLVVRGWIDGNQSVWFRDVVDCIRALSQFPRSESEAMPSEMREKAQKLLNEYFSDPQIGSRVEYAAYQLRDALAATPSPVEGRGWSDEQINLAADAIVECEKAPCSAWYKAAAALRAAGPAPQNKKD
jgi:hypothetical protein